MIGLKLKARQIDSGDCDPRRSGKGRSPNIYDFCEQGLVAASQLLVISSVFTRRCCCYSQILNGLLEILHIFTVPESVADESINDSVGRVFYDGDVVFKW